jgi:hypothetical protein
MAYLDRIPNGIVCARRRTLSLLGFPPEIPSRIGRTKLNIQLSTVARYPMNKGVKEQPRTGQKNNLDGDILLAPYTVSRSERVVRVRCCVRAGLR